jgi:hypothetical protein
MSLNLLTMLEYLAIAWNGREDQLLRGIVSIDLSYKLS